MLINLFINYYRDPHPERQVEIDESVRRNLDNPHVSRVYLMDQTPEGPPPHAKLTRLPLPATARPTFDDYFRIIAAHTAADDVNAILNTDIYFDDSLGLLRKLDMMGRCLALLRWDVLADDRTELCAWDGAVMSNSQDAWMFRGVPKLKTRADFTLGRPGCDNRLARLFFEAGYEVFNPAFDLRSYHLHRSNIRHYNLEKNVLPTPWLFVSPCTMSELIEPRGVVAFSVTDAAPESLEGAIANAKLARDVYPGWAARFYADVRTPAGCIDELKRQGAEVIVMPPQKHARQGDFWRFLVADHNTAPRWVVRDVRSRLTVREAAAVEEWVVSRKPFHVMRDHPSHRAPIPAGGFGGTRGAVPQMTARIANWKKWDAPGSDEMFLAEIVWPEVKDKTLQHDAYAGKTKGDIRPFPTPRRGTEFVGQRFGAGSAAVEEPMLLGQGERSS